MRFACITLLTLVVACLPAPHKTQQVTEPAPSVTPALPPATPAKPAAPALTSDGFEQAAANGMPLGWSATVSSTAAASVGLDHAEHHAGQGALTLSIRQANARAAATRVPAPIAQGGTYLISFWYRATGFGSAGFAGTAALVEFSWLDGDQNLVRRDPQGLPYSAEPWREARIILSAPAGAKELTLNIILQAQPAGPAAAIWLDDLSIAPYPSSTHVGRSWTYRTDRRDSKVREQPVSVADDLALTGRSMTARVGVTPPDTYVAGGFYTDEQPPGRYRVIFRLRVADNSKPLPAFIIDTVDSANPFYAVSSATLLSTDFTQPNTYQAFSLPFVVLPGERGKADFRVRWAGNVDGWAEHITVLEETADDAPVARPAAGSEARANYFTASDPQSHVTLDQARYRSPARAVTKSSQRSVTKADYLAVIQTMLDQRISLWQRWLAQPEPYPDFRALTYAAMHNAFLWRAKGDQEAGSRAIAFIAQIEALLRAKSNPAFKGAPLEFFSLFAAYHAKQWLTGHPQFGPPQLSILGKLAVTMCPAFPSATAERGAFNRPMAYALGGRELLSLVPDAPDAQRWKTYIHAVWNDWWRRRDTTESAGNYNALFLRLVLDWVSQEQRGRAFWQDRGVRQLFERFLLQVAPLGSLPHYGDTTGWNVEWGHWVRIFEEAATGTRDARFKWAAHRIFDYGSSHIEDIDSWTYTGEEAVMSLMFAYLAADDRLLEEPPTAHLSVLSRRAIAIEHADANSTPTFKLTAGKVPDKLVFRGGNAATAPYAMFDLTPVCEHHSARAPALTALLDQGSVLLMAQGYSEHLPEDHNLLLVETYDDVQRQPLAEEKIRVLDSAELRTASTATVTVEQYQGLPVTTSRATLFADSGVMMIRDSLTFAEPLMVRAGASFRVRNIGPEIGEHWVNSYLGESIPVRGIGRGTPVYARWKNPARDLLIYFAPHEGHKLAVTDASTEDPTSTLPKRVQYTWRGTPDASTNLWFTTLLLAHEPMRNPSELAARIHVEVDDDSASVVRIDDGRGGAQWLVLNAGGKLLHAGALETDARQAHLVVDAGGLTRASARGVTRLSLGGRQLVNQRARSAWELDSRPRQSAASE